MRMLSKPAAVVTMCTDLRVLAMEMRRIGIPKVQR